MKDISKYRKVKHKIHPLILNRWSPRVMSGEEITDEELCSLFEAARWAPSSYNNQPWLFLYGKKDKNNTAKERNFNLFFDLLVDFNKSWAKKAAALILILSKKNFFHNNKPSKTHSFDTGAAWQNLALQGTYQGLVVHGMEGFDYEKARKDLNIPNDYTIEAMVAVGKKGEKEGLPKEIQEKELPSNRKEIIEIYKEAKF